MKASLGNIKQSQSGNCKRIESRLITYIPFRSLSDVFEDEVERLSETYGDRGTALSIIEADKTLVRFYLPPEARWPVVSGREQ